MPSKKFTVPTMRFNRRPLTTIQHKLRTVMKCYTVSEFVMKDRGQFSFRKNLKVKGVRINGNRTYHGTYDVEKIDDIDSALTIIVY